MAVVSPSRSQIEPGVHPTGIVRSQQVTSEADRRILPLERISAKIGGVPEGPVPYPRSPSVGTLLPVVARLRQVREPGRTCPPFGRQPGTGDAGASSVEGCRAGSRDGRLGLMEHGIVATGQTPLAKSKMFAHGYASAFIAAQRLGITDDGAPVGG